MAEIEDDIRTLLRRSAPDVPNGFRDHVDQRVQRLLRRRRLTLATGAAAVVVVIGLVVAAIATAGDGDEDVVRTVDSTTTSVASAPIGRWRQIAESPLSARSRHTMVWTGDEVLVVGGSSDADCLGGQGLNDCFFGDATATDVHEGAAYDPDTDTWRRIPDAPIPIGGLSMAAWVGDVALYTDGFGQELVAYDPATDRWSRRTAPPGGEGLSGSSGQNTSIGDTLIVAPSNNLAGQPDLAYDPATDRWTELPDDPLGPSAFRWIVWTGSTLALFASPPGSSERNPLETRVATYDPASSTWTRLTDSPITALAPWLDSGEHAVTTLGYVDVDGRRYEPFPRSGVIDLTSGESSPVPTVPVSAKGGPTDLPVLGRLPAAGGGPSWHWLGIQNRREGERAWLYSPETEALQPVPTPPGHPGPDGGPGGASLDFEIWTGTDLIRWGGITPGESGDQVAEGVGSAFRPPPP